MGVNYDWNCKFCDLMFEAQVNYEDRDIPGIVPCTSCGNSNVTRMFPAPRVSKESYPDGLRRPGWKEMGEAANLEVALANTKPSERKLMRKQIREIKKAAGKQIRDDGVATKVTSRRSEE